MKKYEGHTPGPWKWIKEDRSTLYLTNNDAEDGFVMMVHICDNCAARNARCMGPGNTDAILIADAPALLAEVEHLRKQNEGLTENMNALLESKRQLLEPCVWTFCDDDDLPEREYPGDWETSCGTVYLASWNPIDADNQYCSKCGRKIVLDRSKAFKK